MTRLIDMMGTPEREMVLSTGTWPAGYRPEMTEEPENLPGVRGRTEYAIHEAGHAVAYLSGGHLVRRVEIGNSERFAASTEVHPHDQGTLTGLTGLFAGLAASRHWLGLQGLLDPAAEVDLASAARTDTRVAAQAAGDDRALLAEARDRAERLVRDRWDDIERLAADLDREGVIMYPSLPDTLASL